MIKVDLSIEIPYLPAALENPIPTKELVKNPTVLTMFREFFLNMRTDYINRSSCGYRGYFGGLSYSYTEPPLPLAPPPPRDGSGLDYEL